LVHSASRPRRARLSLPAREALRSPCHPRAPRRESVPKLTMKLTAIAALLLVFVWGCGGNKSSAPGKESAPGSEPSGQPAAQPAAQPAPAGLCIDPRDIQIEPLDLEALDDELPPVPPQGGLA